LRFHAVATLPRGKPSPHPLTDILCVGDRVILRDRYVNIYTHIHALIHSYIHIYIPAHTYIMIRLLERKINAEISHSPAKK
jgi:hypothetical protein